MLSGFVIRSLLHHKLQTSQHLPVHHINQWMILSCPPEVETTAAETCELKSKPGCHFAMEFPLPHLPYLFILKEWSKPIFQRASHCSIVNIFGHNSQQWKPGCLYAVQLVLNPLISSALLVTSFPPCYNSNFQTGNKYGNYSTRFHSKFSNCKPKSQAIRRKLINNFSL